jgi:hypothetical protein
MNKKTNNYKRLPRIKLDDVARPDYKWTDKTTWLILHGQRNEEVVEFFLWEEIIIHHLRKHLKN